MSLPTANEATVYEAVQTIISPLPLDKIVGQTTTSTVNHLRQQIAKIAAAVKTTSWGGHHGHLALVLTDAEYRTVTGNPDITIDRLPMPPIVEAGLTNTTMLTNRASITGLHNLACEEFWKQEAVDALIVDKLMREAVNPTYAEELEDDYVGYSGQTIKTIAQHLRTEWCIVTTLKKKQAAQAFHVQWDFTSHITKFAHELDKQQKLCRDISVPAAEATKIQHYVESMYASEMFDDKEMQACKEKFKAEREARSGGFESASSVFDSGSHASNNPPHVPFSINSALSPADHHSLLEYTNSLEGALENATEHAAAITLDNTTLLHKLEAQQKAILDQQAKFLTLLSPPTAPRQQRNRSNGTPPSEGRRPQRFCNSCKKDGVYHKDDECFALDKNKDKRPSWYKPKK
eukprot:CCRYP_009878-RA/>CCRYP_009878-RA protein AED:0.62 eAED:0.37 QI:0/0/0/0.5/1/1/2/0/403